MYKDELFKDSLTLISHEGKASTSLLQRKLQIGYNRAARIIDQLEEQIKDLEENLEDAEIYIMQSIDIQSKILLEKQIAIKPMKIGNIFFVQTSIFPPSSVIFK